MLSRSSAFRPLPVLVAVLARRSCRVASGRTRSVRSVPSARQCTQSSHDRAHRLPHRCRVALRRGGVLRHATARRHPAPPAQGARPRARRRLLLAARRQPPEPRDARLSGGGERLHTGDPRADRAAPGEALSGARRTPETGRRHRAVPQGRLLVLPPIRGRQGVRPALSSPGLDDRPRGAVARPQRARARTRLLRPRRMGRHAGRPPPRLDRGHRQPPAVHDSRPRPRDRRAPAPRRSPTARATSSGRTTTGPCSTSRRTR